MNKSVLKRNLKIGTLTALLLLGANKANAQHDTAFASNQTATSETQDSVMQLHQKAAEILTRYEAHLCRILHELNTCDMSLAQKQFALEQSSVQLTECADSMYIALNQLADMYKNDPRVSATFEIIKRQFFSIGARYERLRQEILIRIRNMRDEENQSFTDSLAQPWQEYQIQKPLKRQKTR